MDIRQAKDQIKYAMQAYFAKDEFGNYRLTPQRQRPVCLIGPPGIGKTAIMEQIAHELDVALVSYSMTHHTRQSALGLPFIDKKVFGGREYDVSEYTMSEIIASVYEAIELTGRTEGILFLDEINCVSETLTPAMLQFLQYKTFGRHKVPDGWIVVTAGNPQEYNRTVHDFDIATWDRLKRIDVEPDFDTWRDFALDNGTHPAVITYLDIKRSHFYSVETTVDGKSFVTARGWDDLSSMIRLYEEKGLPVDDMLVCQYVQNPEISKQFSVYYDLFTKYRSDYQIDRILAGDAGEEIVQRAADAPFDERVSLMGLLTDALANTLRDAMMEEHAIEYAFGKLGGIRDELGADDATDCAAAVRREQAAVAKQLASERANGLITDAKRLNYQRFIALASTAFELAGGAQLPFGVMKEAFGTQVDRLDVLVKKGAASLDNAFAFAEEAFGTGQEMLLLITALSANRYGMDFINAHGCEKYFEHNQDLLFYERGNDLVERINQVRVDGE